MPPYLLGVYNPPEAPEPNPLTILTTSIPNAIEDQAYGPITFEAAGGVAPYTWTLVAPNNSIPTGMDFDNGVFGGTPTVSGNYPLNVRVTDNLGSTVTTGVLPFAVAAVNALHVTTLSLPSVVRGNVYDQRLNAANGTPPYSWTMVAPNNVLPTGLNLVAAGGNTDVEGTPTVAETKGVIFRVTDAALNTADSGLIAIEVLQVPALNITTSPTLNQGEVGTSYSRFLVTTGGWGAKTWSLISGTLPSGLDLDEGTGEIFGTPLSAGTSGFTIGVEDSEARTDSQIFSLTIVAAGTIEGPDDYFNEWSVHATARSSQSLKLSDEDIQDLQQAPAEPLNGIWGYHPETDTDPEAQDGLKLTVDKFKLDGTRVWSINGKNQLYIRVNPIVQAPDKILFSWDWYWTQKFAVNSGGVYFYKTWQSRPSESHGWWTHCHRIYNIAIRAHYIDAMRVGRAVDMVPNGVLNAGDDRWVPLGEGVEDVPRLTGQYSQLNYENAYRTGMSKWTRYWVEIRLGQPPEAFTSWMTKYELSSMNDNVTDMTGAGRWNMVSMWQADEDREVERVLYQAPVGNGFSQAGRVTSSTINSYTDSALTKNLATGNVGNYTNVIWGGVIYPRIITGISGKTVTVNTDFPEPPPVDARWVISSDKFDFKYSLFSYEMNTSKVGPIGPLVGYGRQNLFWVNYDLAADPESDPIFRKPVR